MTKSLTTRGGRGSLVLAGVLLARVACGGDDDDSAGKAGSAGTGGSGEAGSAGSFLGGAGGSAGDGGAGGTAGSGGASGPTLEAFGHLLNQATCERLATCVGFVFTELTGGLDTCVSLADGKFQSATLAQLQASISSNRVVYDPSKAQACLDDLKAQGCSSGAHFSDVCEQALAGQVPEGGPCARDLECAGSDACDLSTCPGKCTPRSGNGSPCQVTEQCQEGLACNLATGRCGAPAASGAQCGQGVSCNLDAFCLGANEAKKTPGTCETYKDFYSAQSGAACDLLKGPYCAQGLACAIDDPNALTTKCTPLAATGETCRPGIPDMCAPTDYCDGLKAGDAKTNGTCKTRPGEGQPCGLNAIGYTCAAGLVCDASTKVCHAQVPNGSACADNGICQSGFCNTDKVCAVPDACVAP